MPPSLIINWWIHPSCTVSSCLWNLQILHYLCFFIYNFNLIRRESDGIGLKLIPDYVHLKSFRIVAWISVANLSSLWCISNWYRLHLCRFLNMMCFWGLSDIWLGFKHLFFYVYDAFLNYNIYYICACSWLWRGSGLISCCSCGRCSASRRSSPRSRMRLRRWRSRQQLSLAEGDGRLWGNKCNKWSSACSTVAKTWDLFLVSSETSIVL